MSFTETIERRRKKILHTLNYEVGTNKTRISLTTSIHPYVVADMLKLMIRENLIYCKDGLYYLKEEKEATK